MYKATNLRNLKKTVAFRDVRPICLQRFVLLLVLTNEIVFNYSPPVTSLRFVRCRHLEDYSEPVPGCFFWQTCSVHFVFDKFQGLSGIVVPNQLDGSSDRTDIMLQQARVIPNNAWISPGKLCNVSDNWEFVIESKPDPTHLHSKHSMSNLIANIGKLYIIMRGNRFQTKEYQQDFSF